jgi:conjugative relaxase-like TrwC/TraI family protein
MITVGAIKNGRDYLGRHLRKNDYWAEGEKAVEGEWIGEGAKALDLAGAVDPESFERLRKNQHPRTGERLTASEVQDRVAFFDVQLSAPKDVSVIGVVGADSRVRQAFVESAKVALGEMERFAAVRERRGRLHQTEAFRVTGNYVGALFVHDASRDLDPQLHVHAVLVNATWDAERNQWMALQPAEMLRASAFIRQVFYRELAGRMAELGYETHEMSTRGFSVRGVEHLRERFSKRTQRIKEMSEAFTAHKGRRPTKRETEVMVRESREDKLTKIATDEVRAKQRSELAPEEAAKLDQLVDRSARHPRPRLSVGSSTVVLESALRHIFERSSVAREGAVLATALELHPEFARWRALRAAITDHADVIRSNGELTLRSVKREEAATAERVRGGRNTRHPMANRYALPAGLTEGQRAAAEELLRSTDFTSVLIGDAGTGKTTLLRTVQTAHVDAGGHKFVALAPTTRARDGLRESGFEEAETVQRFLASETLQNAAGQRVLLVDEAGLLSTNQLERLTAIAADKRARLLLVGDTKQHFSVERGDGLRNVIKHAGISVTRLTDVLRQRAEADRQFSRLLASGRTREAFSHAQTRGMIESADSDEELFERAAKQYAANVAQGLDTLAVVPFWEEIDRFTVHAREALRREGRLGVEEVDRTLIKPLSWSEEQKAHWEQYEPGDYLFFVKDTRVAKRGEALQVVRHGTGGLEVRRANGQRAKVTRRHRAAFDVGRLETAKLAAGDRVLIRGNDPRLGFRNGDVHEVGSVDPTSGAVRFTNGTLLPDSFKAWTYGHAVTSYRAQGSTSEEAILVLGEVAERALIRRQFYVGNTRHQGRHRIFATNPDQILNRLALVDDRELATEFVERRQMVQRESLALRPFRYLGERARFVWYAVQEQVERARKAITQKQEY